MLDIRFVRENPEAVKENIRKKFQDAKLPLVDEVIKLDAEYRATIGEASVLFMEVLIIAVYAVVNTISYLSDRADAQSMNEKLLEMKKNKKE